MVWGMNIPDSFGEFWPDGDFEAASLGHKGWRERLKAYYLEQAPKAQKELFDYVETGSGIAAHWYAGYTVGKFVSEVGTRSAPQPEKPTFSQIKAHEPPKFFATEKGYASLGSLIALNYGILAVDEALKAIIERLEPGVHQFYPIEIRMPKNKVFPEPYYVVVIGQYFDAVSPEHSKSGSCRENGPDSYFYDASKKGINGLAMRKAAFGSAHLWRQRGFPALFTCFSDELQQEMEKAGLRIPKHYKMMEI